MPYRPLVSKIRVHNPNKVRASVANKNYVKYIATREGVALDDPENVDELMRMPGMEKVSLNEQFVHEKANNENYLRYIACRPRSHGLFGNIDTSDLNAVMKEVAEVSEQNRIVYRGVISLSEKDAEALNFKTSAAWNQYLRKVMPGLAKELGVSSNHTWVAAFHGEQTHPHIHYELWDNCDRVKSSFIHTSTQKKCREFLSKEMFDSEYERMISKVYQEELEELKSIRNLGRESMLRKSEEIMRQAIYVPGVACEVLPDRISHEDAARIKDEVNVLARMMGDTEHGRIAYKFLPEEMKQQVSQIAELIFKRPDIQKEMEEYVRAVGDTQHYHGKTQAERNSAESAARKDMHNRICNKILKVVKDNYDISSGMKLSNDGMDSQMESKSQDLQKAQDMRNRGLKDAGSNLQVEGKLAESTVRKDAHNPAYDKVPMTVKDNADFSAGVQRTNAGMSRQMESGIFDINISYLLVKAALEETRKQAMIQKSRAFDYSRKNRNQSRQNIKEEIKKNKDSSQEPSQN